MRRGMLQAMKRADLVDIGRRGDSELCSLICSCPVCRRWGEGNYSLTLALEKAPDNDVRVRQVLSMHHAWFRDAWAARPPRGARVDTQGTVTAILNLT